MKTPNVISREEIIGLLKKNSFRDGISLFKRYIILNSAEEYRILTTWDNKTIDHEDRPVVIQLNQIDVSFFKISVSAPFFNDPPNPAGEIGDPFYGLWDYEGKILKYYSLKINQFNHVKHFNVFSRRSVFP